MNLSQLFYNNKFNIFIIIFSGDEIQVCDIIAGVSLFVVGTSSDYT